MSSDDERQRIELQGSSNLSKGLIYPAQHSQAESIPMPSCGKVGVNLERSHEDPLSGSPVPVERKNGESQGVVGFRQHLVKLHSLDRGCLSSWKSLPCGEHPEKIGQLVGDGHPAYATAYPRSPEAACSKCSIAFFNPAAVPLFNSLRLCHGEATPPRRTRRADIGPM